jgi:hypothetical protein
MKILFIEYNADSVLHWATTLFHLEKKTKWEPKHVVFLKQFYNILNQNRRE